MMRDYYPALKRATAALGSQTAQARRAVYDRARSFITAAGVSARQAGDERAALESAIERIEAEREPPRAARPPFRRPIESRGSRSARPLQAWWPLAAASTALLMAGLATWALWPNQVTDPGASTTRAAVVAAVPADPEARLGAAPRSYVFNRQMVYYRTVHPVGTVLIAKAQRFLYVVVSNVSAIRYTLGVGRESKAGGSAHVHWLLAIRDIAFTVPLRWPRVRRAAFLWSTTTSFTFMTAFPLGHES